MIRQPLLTALSLSALPALPVVLATVAAPCPAAAADTLVADFDQTSPEFKTRDASARIVDGQDGQALEVTLGHTEAWPNVSFNQSLDLSAHTHLLADLTNVSDESIQVVSKITYKGGSQKDAVGEKIALDPGQTVTMRVALNRPAPAGYEFLGQLEGMDVMPLGNKEGATVDPSRINMIQFFGLKPARPQTFRVDNIRATGSYVPPKDLPSREAFFPFVDKFGQYVHADWPGKVHDDAELAAQVDDERRQLADTQPPAGWDQRGAWADGPTAQATGQWRVEQREGKWWFITPEGRLFWSLGVDVVQPGGSTRVAPDRDGWFADLPDPSDPTFGGLYEEIKNARGKNAGVAQTTFEFYAANMIRKFGEGWEQQFADLAHQRLPAWGFNTLGLWAKGPVLDDPPMPYVHWVFYMSQRIKVWGPNLPKWFPDVYDPSFKENLNTYAGRMLRQHASHPNLIGLFVDNELPWGGETQMGVLAILAPADTPHAQAFVEMLQQKHGDIDGLNAAWNTDFADWDAFGKNQDLPTGDAVTQDLLAFSEQTMRIYFEACREVVRTHAPGKLYLGCRFQEVQVNPLVTRIAAEYCDVVSFNVYRHAVAQWQPPAPIDKPVIIGEFHFGAPDRGVFGTGLVGVESSEAKVDAIKHYVTGAAQNPQIIGAHWFQYLDEMTSGRPLDRENHQVGLVSITDVPHQDTVDAFRSMGENLYQIRQDADPAATASSEPR